MLFANLRGPYAAHQCLTNMRQLQQQHRPDTAQSAADGLRHFIRAAAPDATQLQTIFITGQRQLARQRIGIYANTHRGKLKRIFQHRVPHTGYLAVQTGVAGSDAELQSSGARTCGGGHRSVYRENGASSLASRSRTASDPGNAPAVLTVNKLNLLWQERRQTKLFMRFARVLPIASTGSGWKIGCIARRVHWYRPEGGAEVGLHRGRRAFHVRVQPFARAEVMLLEGFDVSTSPVNATSELGIRQCFHFYLHRFHSRTNYPALPSPTRLRDRRTGPQSDELLLSWRKM